MHDWNNIVRRRLAALNLTAPAESNLAEELAQHLEDRYRDLTAAGALSDDAFRQVLGELDTLHLLRAAAPAERRLPRFDVVPAGDARLGGFVSGLWRDIRYAVAACARPPFSLPSSSLPSPWASAPTPQFLRSSTL